MRNELKEKEILEMNFIPEKYDQFRSHKHFVLPSLLKRYQDLKPGSMSYKSYKFKSEPIHLRKNIINLHTAEQWRRLSRKIKIGEKPIKIAKGMAIYSTLELIHLICF